MTKLSFGSVRACQAEAKTFINLPSRVPLEFSRNSQSPKIRCFCLKLLSNWGFTQTMHRAVEYLKMILRSFPSAWAGSRVSKIPTSGFRAHFRFCFIFMISCYTSNRSELKIAQIEAYDQIKV